MAENNNSDANFDEEIDVALDELRLLVKKMGTVNSRVGARYDASTVTKEQIKILDKMQGMVDYLMPKVMAGIKRASARRAWLERWRVVMVRRLLKQHGSLRKIYKDTMHAVTIIKTFVAKQSTNNSRF